MLLRASMTVLEGLFFTGIAGSLVVVTISFVEDIQDLFEAKE